MRLLLLSLCLFLLVSGESKQRLCGVKLLQRLKQVCTLKNGTTCFKGNFVTPVKKEWMPFHLLEEGQQLNWKPHRSRRSGESTTEGVATECCTKKCGYSYLKSFCCKEGS